MSRHVQFPALVLSAFVVASCGTEPTPAAGAGDCEFRQAADGSLTCVPLMQGQSPGMSNPMSNGGPGNVPDLGSPSVPDLGSPSVPDLGSPASTEPVVGPPSSSGPETGPVATEPGVAPSAPGGPVTPSGPVAAGGSGPVAAGGAGPVAAGGMPSVPVSATLATIQVDAGSLARDHSVVTFPFPQGEGKNLVLKDAAGNQLPLQMSPLGDGKATFILPSLGAGEQATYTVEEVAAALPFTVTAMVDGDHLFVRTPMSTVFRWTLVVDNPKMAAARDTRAGYIYPVYTPKGLNVADDYAPDHPHMHGIWSAWTSTTFRGHKVDFWNGYADQGRVDLNETKGLWSGAVHAGLVATLDHIDITTDPDVVVLSEQWIVTVYKTHDDPAPYFIYDIDSVQEAVTSDPLYLEQYHYGGFGYRGSEQWQTVANVEYLTSEGHTRANGDGQNARWCAQYGTVDGQRGGYAAFDHPTNFRHPQGLRIHPTNPYWAFVPVTPLKGGPFTLEPGVPYHSLYRIVAFDGNADAAMLNRLWDEFATPPTVTVLP